MDEDHLKLIRTPVLIREIAVDTLRRAIAKGALKPGERLVEGTISKRMGISRPSIREAFAQLSSEKLITLIPNKGPVVATVTTEEVAAIYDLRSLLEPEVAARFALGASKEDLASLKACVRNIRRLDPGKAPELLLEAATQFDKIVLDRCANIELAETLRALNARLGFVKLQHLSRPKVQRPLFAALTDLLTYFEQRDEKNSRATRLYFVRSEADAVLSLVQNDRGQESQLRSKG